LWSEWVLATPPIRSFLGSSQLTQTAAELGAALCPALFEEATVAQLEKNHAARFVAHGQAQVHLAALGDSGVAG
jgi:hypothetical protein